MFCYFEGDTRPYIKKKKNPNDQKDYVYCTCVSFDDNGRRMKCDYEKRIDHHRKAVNAKKHHTCHFVPCKEDNDIRNYAQEAIESETETTSAITLFDELCILVGRLNLSLEAACSDTMYNFINKCVNYGIALDRSFKNAEERFSSEFPQPKRDKFRHRFITLANEINRKRMKQFSHVKYTSVALDEGSTLKTPYLDFVLHNTKEKLGEYVAATEVMSGGKTENYIASIPKGLLYISKYNIKLSTVVIDGNTAQLKAFKKEFKTSLRSHDDDMIRHLIVVPCLCHRVNNSYKFAIQHDPNFSALINRMRKIATILKESDSAYNNCPNFIDTRWIYDYDILIYLKKNIVGINEYLKSNHKDTISEEMLDLENMLMILKKLTVIFEDSNQPLSSAYKILEASLDAMKEAESLSKNPSFYRQVRNSLKAYTISSKEGGLLLLSYILTPEGLKDISQRKSGLKRKKGKLNDFVFHQNQKAQDSHDSHADFVKKAVMENFFEPETEEADPTETVTKSEVKAYLQRSCSVMKEICDTLEYDAKRKENVLKAFDSYLLLTLHKSCKEFRETIDNKTWNWEIIDEDEMFHDFADIALRLEPTPCSEASAERAISLQRLVILKRRNKALKDLIDARLVYMRCGPKKFIDDYYL